MGGRQFNATNKVVPACVVAMAENPPACFEAPVWRIYLHDHYRGTLNDPAARARLNRLEVPDYCEDCTVGYQAAMQACGKCRPPAAAAAPLPSPNTQQQLALC